MKYNELYNIANQVEVFSIKRGHNYALEIWHAMFQDWCEKNNIKPEQIDTNVIKELKNRSMIFCDYFI
jgi:hypothetical protein